MERHLLLVDCRALCYSAYFSQGELAKKDGEGSGVIYGFFNQIKTACLQTGAVDLVFAWDSRESKRRELFPGYKINRVEKEIDQNLLDAFEQFDALKDEILPACGFKNNFLFDGLEADDIIASICQDYVDKHKITIISNDHDLYQLLVKDRVQLFKPIKNIIYTEQDFKNEFGLGPYLWSRVKAYAGCHSDAVPGIRGIGEKSACGLLRGDETMRGYAGIVEKIKSPEGREIYKRNMRLVRLPFDGTPRIKLKFKNRPSYAGWIDICAHYEFKSFLKEPAVWESIFSGIAPYSAKRTFGKGKRK